MPLKTHQDEQPTLNLTPMIDIMFLLIIFFMVGTKFAEWEHKLALKVPEVKETETLAPAPEKRVINVYRDGRISLDDELVTLDQLATKLNAVQQEYSGLGVVVRGTLKGRFSMWPPCWARAGKLASEIWEFRCGWQVNHVKGEDSECSRGSSARRFPCPISAGWPAGAECESPPNNSGQSELVRNP